MRSARFRRAARLFAALLLAWTAVDLVPYGLCAHDREPLVPALPTGAAGPLAVAARDAGRTPETPIDNGPDDCFCCCRVVDVNVPFHVSLTYAVVWAVPPDAVERPHLAPSQLYHPPLA